MQGFQAVVIDRGVDIYSCVRNTLRGPPVTTQLASVHSERFLYLHFLESGSGLFLASHGLHGILPPARCPRGLACLATPCLLASRVLASLRLSCTPVTLKTFGVLWAAFLLQQPEQKGSGEGQCVPMNLVVKVFMGTDVRKSFLNAVSIGVQLPGGASIPLLFEPMPG